MRFKDLPKDPIAITWLMLDTKWKPLIIQELLTGSKRFGQIKLALGKVTQKVLTANLRDMEAKGLLVRTEYKEMPPRVEYTLTDIGYSLAGVLENIAQWGCDYRELTKFLEKQSKKK